jgi:hypothetical protein
MKADDDAYNTFRTITLMLRRSLCAIALAVFLLAACNGGGGGKSGALTITDVQKATAKEKSAAIAGTRALGKESGPVAGKYQDDPAEGTYTAPVFVPGAKPTQAEVRFVDKNVYVSRATVPVKTRQSEQLLMPDFLGMRVEGEQLWLKVPPVLASAIGTPALQGPFAFLDALVKANAALVKQGSDKVDGTSVTRYDVSAPAVFAAYGQSTVTIWVDSKDRLRRALVIGTTSIDYTVGNFGTAVDVSAPPASETATQLPPAGPPAPQPTGAFTQAATGASGGLEWTLSKGPGTRNSTCWKLETTPPVDLLDKGPVCLLPKDPKVVGRGLAVQFPFQSGATGAHDIVVGIAPPSERVRDVRFDFTNTATAPPTYLDKNNGIVVWAGNSRPFLGAGTITLADGATLGCGPGDVVGIDQLLGKSEQQLLDYRKYPWGCIEN